jgi:hypothetical protein
MPTLQIAKVYGAQIANQQISTFVEVPKILKIFKPAIYSHIHTFTDRFKNYRLLSRCQPHVLLQGVLINDRLMHCQLHS